MDNSNYSVAGEILKHRSLRLFTDNLTNTGLIQRIYDLAKDIFDFVHIHQWLIEEIEDTSVVEWVELRGQLDQSHTLSLEIHLSLYHPVVTGCIIEERGSLMERKCYMTLNPQVWTDMVGWCSWARSTFEETGLDLLYVSVPVSKKPWKIIENRIVVPDMTTGLGIPLPEGKWLEINPLRTSLRPINREYKPVGPWLYPSLTSGAETQSWVRTQLHTGIFDAVDPPIVKYDPSDNYPKYPKPDNYPKYPKQHNKNRPPISIGSNGKRWGREIDPTVHVDSGIDDLDKLLEAEPQNPGLDRNPNKGRVDLSIETFDMLELKSPKKKTQIRPDSGVEDLKDLF